MVQTILYIFADQSLPSSTKACLHSMVLTYKRAYLFFMFMQLWNLLTWCMISNICLSDWKLIDNWYWSVELNLYARHGMFMLIMSALLTQLMWALCSYWNRTGNRWSYFSSKTGWFYKCVFKLSSNQCWRIHVICVSLLTWLTWVVHVCFILMC